MPSKARRPRTKKNGEVLINYGGRKPSQFSQHMQSFCMWLNKIIGADQLANRR